MGQGCSYIRVDDKWIYYTYSKKRLTKKVIQLTPALTLKRTMVNIICEKETTMIKFALVLKAQEVEMAFMDWSLM